MSRDPARHITLYHARPSRSFGTRVLLEELEADYTLELLDLKAGDQLKPAFLAVNPMGKVPTIVHGDTVVSEQPAVFLYLAELYGERGLSPAVGDPLRGAYLRWMVYYGSCFEPAMVDRAMKREPGARAMSPYADADTVLRAIEQQVAVGPWWLGERYTAADVLWGTALNWMMQFKLTPATPALQAYVERVTARPAYQRVVALEAAADDGHAAPSGG